ncbi:MAG: phosphopantothenate--cysteine ligase [Oscillospiraceae bacterium]|jgi:phosphopantothenate-cysteine ligase|nr:phosphopantothenate--cysteine ligase [Oscillospiraceae bacterium]
MNIIVTAGGTTEKIDAIRAITNSSTGRLGAAIAERFAESPEVGRVFYLHGAKAVKPASEKALRVPAHDTASLEAELRRLAGECEIDAVIHAMAVSDYRVSKVTDGEFNELDRTKKISSEEESLVVFMEKTPKIISFLRGLFPKACIVGFKLLDGVSEAELLTAARGVLTKNDCDFALANDAQRITLEAHPAQLLDRSREVIASFNSKTEIAAGIFSAVTQNIEERRK